ncbi:MAG: branched-chain amino acid aminotransferase, partial [Flammeovirgaceae bacterium]|nr:branched-chain amino acid aminotransferase [Flammeovirgaceae bacterium]MDW8287536.1 branched-chain amino acid aminotransferase [Flammeovirgaceae bacterium]
SDHMFEVEFKEGTWQNARIVPYENFSLSPATSALHYGQSIFEGLKAYKSETEDKILIFRPQENARRMQNSAVRLCMPPLPEQIFMEGLHQLIDIDRNWVPSKAGCSLYIRPFMFATDEYLGLRPSNTYKFLIITSPVGTYYTAPVKVKVERHYSRSCEGGTGAAKCAGNYAASMYPAKLAQEKGFHQLLWTDAKEHRYIEEAGTMNVMFIIDNVLVTAPTTKDTILDGITRKSVLHLAREWGMKVEERYVSVEELITSVKNNTLQEAFGVGTAATISNIAVIHCDGVDYEMPPVEKREFSKKALQYLSDVQRGRIPDKYGWIYKV